MINFLKDALNSPAGSFGFIFALLILAFWLVYKFSHYNTKFSSVDKLESNIDKIKDDIASIKGFIDIVKTKFNPFAQAQSPINLTEKGVSVSNELNAEKLVRSHWEEIMILFDDKINKGSNPYDIQQCSMRIGEELLKILTPAELDIVKSYAYKNGHTISTYDAIFGVIIRNNYFTAKGIDLSEIDKHDPNKATS